MKENESIFYLMFFFQIWVCDDQFGRCILDPKNKAIDDKECSQKLFDPMLYLTVVI